ncbi:MAG: hypothetical protein ACKVT0_15725 [Planctomycetaceae bacterium]
MLIFFAVVSLILLGIVSVIYLTEPVSMTAVYGFLGLLILLTMFPPLIAAWFFAFLIAIACKTANVRWRNYVLCHALILVLLNSLGWSDVIKQIPEMQELKATYQPQAIDSRLPYETEIPNVDDERTSTADAPDARSELLIQTESEVWSQPNWESKRRTRGLSTLMSLHQGTVSEFQVANGFGVGRMGDIRPRKEFIDLPSPGPVKQPEWTPPPYDPLASPPQELVFADESVIGAEHSNPLAQKNAIAFHVDQIVNFANASGFGYVDRERRQMIGFQSHGFRTPPQWASKDRDSKMSYDIARLELISLLKHTPPAAYLSDNLPSMDELKSDSAPTRKLDEFEQQAISRLEQGEDLIVAEDQLGLRMVGAIRAVDECLQCHRGREGKLLGGFTYRLKPAKSESDTKSSPAKKPDIPDKQKPLT